LLIQKKNAGLLYMFAKKMKGNEVGVTFIETLIALAILGIIAVAFLSGLATGAQATFIADQRATAESLARSHMEYVKNLDYQPDASEYLVGPEELTIPEGWVVPSPVAVSINPDTGEPSEADMGIQKIRVIVYHGDKPVLTVVGYKVNRYEAE